MNKPKVKRTQWYDPNVKPVRPGVYERLYKDDGPMLSYWDGRQWGFTQEYSSAWPSARKLTDATFYRNPPSPRQELPWRGITYELRVAIGEPAGAA